MEARILKGAIQCEVDVVTARQRARTVAAMCGFGAQDQARVATAVSELARNVFSYAGSGTYEFAVQGETSPQLLVIKVQDQGPGIRDLDHVLSGSYQSRTGMGLGLIGVRRLMDQFEIVSAPGTGTTVVLKKLVPPGVPVLTAERLRQFHSIVAAGSEADVAFQELQQQNQELLTTLFELKSRQDELLELTRELEDTNRGVVALYAELDEKADHLRRADEMKSRFLSNMSHEFRTPLSSIRALGKMLLDRIDGELTPEQERQVGYMVKSAESLSELVNDLLDIAKIEAGRTEIRLVEFKVDDMFSALRGMLRPLLVTQKVALVFHDNTGGAEVCSDEAKVSQILRNFISNALKFTLEGGITVSADRVREGDRELVRFSVADTGIGIAPEDHAVIFEEFGQVENPLQSKVKGTGLGLPLCRKLAALLGGRVELDSEVGRGSTFSFLLPVTPQRASQAGAARGSVDVEREPVRNPVLVIEDDTQMAEIYGRFLAGTGFTPVFARSLREADRAWTGAEPVAVVLDIDLNGESAWKWLAGIKAADARRHVPVIIATMVDDRGKGYALGAQAYFVKPVFRDQLIAALETLTGITANAPEPGTPAPGDAIKPVEH